MLGVMYTTAWFMTHRIGEAIREMHPGDAGSLGGRRRGKEANKHASKRQHRGRGAVGKEPVVTLLERGGNVTASKSRT